MSILKRDFELKKSLHILVFDQEKGKVNCIKMYGAKKKKAKGYLLMLKYQKFQAPISKKDVLFKK